MHPIGTLIDKLTGNFNAAPGALVCSETLMGYLCVFVFILNKHVHTNKDHHLMALWLKVRPTHTYDTSTC